MIKVIPKLKDLIESIPLLGFKAGEITLAATNIDDIFTELHEKGIKDVQVSWKEMYLIVMYVVANITCNHQCVEGSHEEINWSKQALAFIKEGEIDEFLGVKLTLYD